MPITTLTSREFNRATSRAKNASRNGPVFITDRGRPAHVLMTIDEYRRITGGTKITELLSWPGAEDVELPIRREIEPPRDIGF